MNTSQQHPHDLAYLRALAEAGRNAPLQAGPYLVAGGGWFAAASFFLGLDSLGLINLAQHAVWVAWGLASAGFLVTLMQLLRREKRRVPNITNSAIGAAWSAAGLGIWAFFIAAALIAARSGQFQIFNTVALVVLVLYGVCWKFSADITHQRWMYGITAITIVCLMLVAWSIGTLWMWMAYAAALMLCGVLPGLYLIHLSNARQGRFASKP